MSAAAIDRSVSKSRRKHPDLLFEWIGGKGHRWRLLLFLNLSLALHVACFYAFQVVYPPTVRQRAETTKVTFLDPRNDAGVRAVIGRIEDRAVFFDGAQRLPIPGASLENERANDVLPVPAFATHTPSLRIPPAIDLRPKMPGVFAVGEVFLPPRSRLLGGAEFPPERPKPFEGPYVYRPKIVATGGLAELKVEKRPDWSDSQEQLAGASGNLIQFLVEVNSSGRITSCLPWKGIETAFDAAMARKLETGMRFAPAADGSSGWLEMRW